MAAQANPDFSEGSRRKLGGPAVWQNGNSDLDTYKLATRVPVEKQNVSRSRGPPRRIGHDQASRKTRKHRIARPDLQHKCRWARGY